MEDKIGDEAKIIAEGAIFLFVGLIVSKTLWYSYRLFIGRFLGPEKYGIFSLAFSVFIVSMLISTLGISKGAIHYISTYISQKKPSKIRGIILSSFELTMPLSILIAGALFVIAPSISNFILREPATLPIIRIFAVTIPLQTFLSNINDILKSYEKMDYFSLIEKILQPIALFVISAGLVFAGFEVIGLAIAYAVSILISGVIGFYILQTRVVKIFDGSADREYRKLLGFSIPIFGAELGGLIQLHSDNFMLGWFANTGAIDIGIYNAVFPTAMLIFAIGTLFSNILLPLISSSLAANNQKKAIDITSVSFRWIVAIASPLTVLISLFSGPILRILFGTSYVVGSTVLSVIVIAIFVKSALLPFRDQLIAQKRTKLIFVNNSIVAVTNIVLNYLLIPLYGILGAGIAISISFVLGSLMGFLESTYLLDIRPSIKNSFTFIIASIISILPVFMILRSVTGTLGLYKLISLTLIYGITYIGVLVLVSKPTPEDKVVIDILKKKLDLIPKYGY